MGAKKDRYSLSSVRFNRSMLSRTSDIVVLSIFWMDSRNETLMTLSISFLLSFKSLCGNEGRNKGCRIFASQKE